MSIPSNVSNEEFLKYYLKSSSIETIEVKFTQLISENKELREVVVKNDKYYESNLEQSSFRRDVIEMILEVCKAKNPRFTETKELIKEIQLIVENSYVEL